ncbi:MAG: sigma 54-interacting transcriptional regulator [Peptococcaceae bacterium]|nr:sigma 54-interacting transcriptional regulator [Peptococcaceae bacterium]
MSTVHEELKALYRRLETVEHLNRELEAIIESTSDGIFVTDGEGVVLRVNKAYEQITGYTADRLVGKSMHQLIAEGLFERSVTLEAIYHKKPFSTERKGVSGNTLLVTGRPVLNERGEVFRVVVSVRDFNELNRLRHEVQYQRALAQHFAAELNIQRARGNQEKLVAKSPAMVQVVEIASRVAQFNTTVLLLGESGVGKEVLARFIHEISPRREKPFIKVNCAAIPETLLETELFGYAPGAFTGATREGKPGLFELAHQGSILLDEIVELPLGLQAKLLRVLQEPEITRVGETRPRRVDVRVIAATNKNITHEVEKGRFRSDLYFRLNVVPINIPPLRERAEDIIPLVAHFSQRLQEKYGAAKVFKAEVLNWFLGYHWPGNVRELENLVERLFVVVPGKEIDLSYVDAFQQKAAGLPASKITVQNLMPLREAVRELENQLIEKALAVYGSSYKAAEVLKVDPSTIIRKRNQLKGMRAGRNPDQ